MYIFCRKSISCVRTKISYYLKFKRNCHFLLFFQSTRFYISKVFSFSMDSYPYDTSNLFSQREKIPSQFPYLGLQLTVAFVRKINKYVACAVTAREALVIEQEHHSHEVTNRSVAVSVSSSPNQGSGCIKLELSYSKGGEIESNMKQSLCFYKILIKPVLSQLEFQANKSKN